MSRKSWIDEISIDRLTEAASTAAREAVAAHHAAGRATAHGDSNGRLYLLFPDQSERFFPAEAFPADETDRLPFWLKWCEFAQGLFQILTPAEWAAVGVRYGRREGFGPFYAEIDAAGLSAEHLAAARALADRIEAEHRTEQEYLA